MAQKQIVSVEHRNMPKIAQIMKSGMNQVQVPPFELKLRQDVATAPRNPTNLQNALRGGAAAQFTLLALFGCCCPLRGSTSGGVYAGSVTLGQR